MAKLIQQCSICNIQRLDHQIVMKLEDTTCCYFCVDEHDSLGKFEQYRNDSERMAICLILNKWSLDGSEDDYMTNDGWGYCARFGQYLFMHDTQGFLNYEDYGTEEKAQKRFNELYEDGWGAHEDDAYIGQDRGKWIVVFDGKHLNLWPDNFGEITQRRALARIRLEMIRTGYYPNVWEEHERGGLTLIKGL